MALVTDPRPGIADRLSRMIQLPTVSAELDQRGMQPFEDFLALLRELYPLTHEALALERHTDFGLLFHWRGRAGRTADPVVLMAHYDVVPVDESDDWTHPPFAGVVSDGIVYGRGALDDKGPLIVVLEAVENLLAGGFSPARDVYLSFGGNEETFGRAAEEIARVLRDRGIVPWLVVDEGGAVVDAPLPFVPGRAAMIGVGEKGVMTLTLSARGDGGHASAPPSLTAVRRVARAVDRLGPTTFRPRVSTAVARMLTRFAAETPGAARHLLRLLGAAPWLTGRVFAALGGEAAALVRTTVAPTMQSGGTAANVLPSQASATVNLRIALGETTQQTVLRVRRRIRDPLVTVTVVDASEPSPESSVDTEQFALLADALAVSHPGIPAVPYVMMAATDSRHFHRFAPAVYRFAPLEMSNAQRASIHGVDEHVEIAALERGERFHRALLERLG
ncbi:M20/M25/M40 family metallo-hydrolase [Microbacterium hydrocarbonoxydans]|uniref:M20/M25/M40 family metallo-hydrolase n=1 Tax=Microbacterium hydrocarbonoxydans TaxID=273678 RepID=UPI00203F60F6|nr:M20/M25/M40 family metallo-hydrolase [Microbacterium hydrocarbonoxydans]MCM3781167.1 M20/M25/M40 family metallo-hydrolase [Microbacterium hydrocarbonoxydans]